MTKQKSPFGIVLFFFFILFIVSFGAYYFITRKQQETTFVLGNKEDMVGILNIVSPAETTVTTPFTVELVLDTKGKAVNAVGLHATYDPQLLEIINLDTTQSFCQFYPVNRFNNIQGTITIECGAPSPGFNGKNTIAKIKFFAKTIGNAIIKIKPTSQILLNNGKGTNIFSGPSQKTVLILNSI